MLSEKSTEFNLQKGLKFWEKFKKTYRLIWKKEFRCSYFWKEDRTKSDLINEKVSIFQFI